MLHILSYRDFRGDERPISVHHSLSGAKQAAQACENQDAGNVERRPRKLRWGKPVQGETVVHHAEDEDGGLYYVYVMEAQP